MMGDQSAVRHAYCTVMCMQLQELITELLRYFSPIGATNTHIIAAMANSFINYS